MYSTLNIWDKIYMKKVPPMNFLNEKLHGNNSEAIHFNGKWNEFVERIIDEPCLFDGNPKRFENELTIAKSMATEKFRLLSDTFLHVMQENVFHDENVSNKYRNEGNQLFKEDKAAKSYAASNSYTKALFSCPRGPSAALCHANRAAALIQLGFFKEAYDDCECAIYCNYPNATIEKVYARQGVCAVELKDTTKLEQAILNLEKLPKQLETMKNILNFKKDLIRLEIESLKLTEENVKTEVQNVEKVQKIMSAPNKGRYVIAGEPVSKFETIMVEKAFAFVPVHRRLRQVIDVNCQNCGQENIIPFPCYSCSHICFCSPACRDEFNPVHSIECNGIKKGFFTEIGIGHLAFRTFLIGFDTLMNHIIQNCSNKKHSLEELWKQIEDFTENDNSTYASVLRLNTNFNKMKFSDIKRYAMAGTMLTTYLLKFTNFFDKRLPKEYLKITSQRNWEIIISALITRHIGQMITNAHTICGLELSIDKRLNIWKSKNHLLPGKLGFFLQCVQFYAAIYPRVSLYNHSCEANFYNRFNKTELTVIAAKDLKSGDEIFNCYGRNYRLMERTNRLNELKQQYHFDCKCKHCNNVNDTEYKRFRNIKCSQRNCNHQFFVSNNWWDDDVFDRKFQIKCPKCNSPVNLEWYKEWSNVCQKVMLGMESKPVSQFRRINELYEAANKCLVGAHSLKQDIMLKILNVATTQLCNNNGDKIDKKIYSNFIKVGGDYLNAVEEMFSFYSLEYVSAATCVLDLLVYLKHEGAKMKCDYDLEKIRKAVEILSDDTKKTFQNYIADYVEELFIKS